VKFGPTKMKGNALDFSFSGLKTAVLYHVRENGAYADEIRSREEALARGERKFEQLMPLCSAKTLGLVREFQNAVVRDLVERTMRAAEELSVESVLVSGGVAANSQLRTTFEERAKAAGVEVFFSEPGAFDGQCGNDRGGGVFAIAGGHSCGYEPECGSQPCTCLEKSFRVLGMRHVLYHYSVFTCKDA